MTGHTTEFSIQININPQMFWIKPAENMQEEVVRRECELILQRLVSEVKYEITSQVLRKMQEEWRKRGGVPIVDEGGEG